MQDLSNLVVYNDGELELKVSVDSETIWLTQLQMSQLFDTSAPADLFGHSAGVDSDS